MILPSSQTPLKPRFAISTRSVRDYRTTILEPPHPNAISSPRGYPCKEMLETTKESLLNLRKLEESRPRTTPKSKKELPTFIGSVIYDRQFLPEPQDRSRPTIGSAFLKQI